MDKFLASRKKRAHGEDKITYTHIKSCHKRHPSILTGLISACRKFPLVARMWTLFRKRQLALYYSTRSCTRLRPVSTTMYGKPFKDPIWKHLYWFQYWLYKYLQRNNSVLWSKACNTLPSWWVLSSLQLHPSFKFHLQLLVSFECEFYCWSEVSFPARIDHMLGYQLIKSFFGFFWHFFFFLAFLLYFSGFSVLTLTHAS